MKVRNVRTTKCILYRFLHSYYRSYLDNCRAAYNVQICIHYRVPTHIILSLLRYRSLYVHYRAKKVSPYKIHFKRNAVELTTGGTSWNDHTTGQIVLQWFVHYRPKIDCMFHEMPKTLVVHCKELWLQYLTKFLIILWKAELR